MSSSNSPLPDQSTEPGDPLLDELFGRVLALVQAGREVVAEELVRDRPDLHDHVRELTELAAEVAVRRPLALPHFAGYDLVRELGRGGMGAVYLARDERSGAEVALKTMPAGSLPSSRSRQRFVREARAVAALAHPGIVRILDVGETDPPYFTMEWIEGMTLGACIHGLRRLHKEPQRLTGNDLAAVVLGPLAAEAPEPLWQLPYPAAIAEVAAQVADALHHAHERGIVHRDVKPSNIVLRPDSRVVLFDFGLAQMDDAESLTLSGDFLGTPHYTAPEQAAGRRGAIGPRSDLFSLGATLYELVTLQRPFYGETPSEVLRAIQSDDPTPPRELHPGLASDLETICAVALAREPDRRYTTAAAMALDLRRFANGDAILARPPGVMTRAEDLEGRLADALGSALGDRDDADLVTLTALARTFAAKGNHDAAEPLLQQVLAARKAQLGARHPDTLLTLQRLAEVHRRQGRLAEARGELEAVVQALEQADDASPTRRAEAQALLAELEAEQ